MARDESALSEAELERRFLEFVFSTDATITAPAVAFYTRCTLGDAERFLDQLARTGTLRVEHDDDGNIFYLFPNRKRLDPPPPVRAATGPASRAPAAGPGGPPTMHVGNAHPGGVGATVSTSIAGATVSASIAGAATLPAAPGAPTLPAAPGAATLPAAPGAPALPAPGGGGALVAAPPAALAEGASTVVACPYCGEEIRAIARKCKHCGELLDPALRAQHGGPLQVNVGVQNVPAVVPEQAPLAVRGKYINPGTAALLSFIWPGAGQVYTGHVGAGIGWMTLTFFGYLMFVIPGLILHVLGVFSAASYARHENRRNGHE